MTETGGSFKRVGRYGRAEVFAGRESLVIEVSEEERASFSLQPLRPATDAANRTVTRALQSGVALDRKALIPIYKTRGNAVPASVDNLYSQVRTGRFTARNNIAVRIVNVGGEHWLFDARIPEAHFPS